MESEESQPGKVDISSHMVCQPRQRKSNYHPSSASQGAAGLLMEMENSHCWVGSNSPSQRCDPHSGWEVVTRLSEHCSGFTNSASRRCRRRLAAVCWCWTGSAGNSISFSLFVAQALGCTRNGIIKISFTLNYSISLVEKGWITLWSCPELWRVNQCMVMPIY